MESRDGLISLKLWLIFSRLPVNLENNADKGNIFYLFRWVNHLDPKINK